MSIDPRIPLGVESPRFNSPFEVLGQMQGLQQQQQAIRSNQALEEQRRAEIAAKERLAKQTQAIDQIMQTSMKLDEDSGVFTFDLPTFEQGLIKSGNGHLYPQLAEHLNALDKSTQEAQSKRNSTLARALVGLGDAGDTESAAIGTLAYLKKNQLMSDAHVQQVQQSIAADPSPEGIKALRTKLGAQIPEYGELLKGEEKRKSDLAHVAAESANLAATARKSGIESDQLLASGGKKPTTEAELDAAAQALLAKKALGTPLTREESANLTAYQERKRTVSDPARIAADERQSRGIEASIAQQGRAQTFAQQEAGRKELSAKVEQPYLDAREKADTLRNVIAASEGGNMAAGAVTPLLATLGFVTMEGVKRINTTELQQVEGAGSLLERIKGQASKLAVGKPMSDKLTNDLKDLATLLEKSARKKYEDAHAATTKRYGLTDEKPLPDPSAASGQMKIRNVKTGKVGIGPRGPVPAGFEEVP